MYNDVKLEKGLYNLSGKSFTAALEELDPTSAYCGTPLEKLDAFERQLKRFNIHISGDNCDRVEKFFASTDSAVLFPEFISRSIRKGFNDTIFRKLYAAKTVCESGQYVGVTYDDSLDYNPVIQAQTIAAATVRESTSATPLLKYGRVISASYEAVRRQRLDVFGIILRNVGMKLANAIIGQAIDTLSHNAPSISTTKLTYSDLARLYGEFETFNLNSIVVSPKTAAQIFAMEELSDITADENGKIMMPFGAELIKSGAASDNVIIGFDRDFALEFVTSSGLVMETDKLIDRQLDQIAVSISCAFRKITSAAVCTLEINS